ncbi:MAG: hypothetical protein ABEL76_10485, partial [Bradymonadaceae bacterium]
APRYSLNAICSSSGEIRTAFPANSAVTAPRSDRRSYSVRGGFTSKFGIAPGDAERARELVESAGARVEGLHAHLGSDISSPEVWAETGVFLAETAELFPDAEILDVGGGLGVSERAGQPPLDLETAGAKLESLRELHPGFELWLEPGRFLVADAGVLLAEVTQLKQKQDIQFVGVDTGMNSLVRPALYGAHHDIENLSRLGEAPRLDAEIVGPICESGDVLGHDRRLPATREGDVLLVAQTGAYGRVMSSEYNRRSPGEEVVLGE